MKTNGFSRRNFLQRSLAFAAGAPLALTFSRNKLFAAEHSAEPGADSRATPRLSRSDAKVAIVQCRSYGPEVRAALDKCFDLLGGLGSLVKNKTVTVKLNLTGTNFEAIKFHGDDREHPVGETYMTHYATVLALGTALFANGAKR